MSSLLENPLLQPRPQEEEEISREWSRRFPAYFIHEFCWIKDDAKWIPFKLWQGQIDALHTISENKKVIILKARQLGLTWLVLAYALWLILFKPGSTVILFSLRDDEAVELMDRLKKMHDHLPPFMQQERLPGGASNDHEWELANGSRVLAFPTTGGRSYTATLAIVDEADIIPDMDKLLNAVEPTIDAGGKLIMLSTSDKSKPESLFKRIFQAATDGGNEFTSIFLPWSIRPERTAEWYEQRKKTILANTGAVDDLYQEYPATPAEALAPRTLDKRIPPQWLIQCHQETKCDVIFPNEATKPPAINGLVVYRKVKPGKRYCAGADTAEGNPTSDDSSMTVLDQDTGEEVASLNGKFEPSTFASHIDEVCKYFNNAPVLVERNNHGHAVLLQLHNIAPQRRRLGGHDQKPGWPTTAKSKALMYSHAADAFRDQETIIHSVTTFHQLCSIEGSTLSAPEGQHDDRAIGYVLALVAMRTIDRQGTNNIPAPMFRG